MAPSLYFGTSGYAYKAWRGKFYPDDLPPTAMLACYAKVFACVELNSTFYRMPKAETLAAMCPQVPKGFTFAVKAPQQITHRKRLRDVEDVCGAFFAATAGLASHRGPHLFGLPPYLQKDLPRLQAFLSQLPKGVRVAVEFRHPSWHDDKVFALLHKHNVALCLHDTDDNDLRTPREVTADFGYVRLRRASYSDKALALWHAWVQAQPCKHTFVFCKHEEGAAGVGLAKALLALGTS